MDQKLKKSGRDILGYLLLVISVIMLGRSLMLCFSNDIWYDELFTVGMIEHSCGDLIRFTAKDVHPPLYYMITKFVVDLCKLISMEAGTVVIAKMVSVLPYFILLLYCVTFIRKNFGIFTGGLFLFCAIAMPQLGGYTVEVRMYSWALLFVTAAMLHAYGTIHTGREEAEDAVCDAGSRERDTPSLYHAADKTSDKEKNIDSGSENFESEKRSETGRKASRAQKLHGAALVCYGLAAAYTQYFACVAVVMVYLYVFLVFLIKDRSRIKEWVLWAAVSVVCYIPWLFALYSQITAVSAGYWILPLSWRTFGGCVKFLMKPAFTSEALNVVLAVVMSAVYAGVIGYHILKLYQNRKNIRRITESGKKVGDRSEKGRARDNGEGEEETGERIRSTAHTVFMLAGIGVLAGLVLFGYTASVLVRPIFVYRYMIPAMGCFWLSFAVGLDDIWRAHRNDGETVKKVKISRMVPGVLTFFILIVGLRDYRAFMGEEEYKILLMKQTEEALSSIAPKDIILYNFDQVQAVTSYYLPEDVESYLWCGTPETLIQEIVRPYGMLEDAASIQTWCKEGRTVWFIGSFNSRDDIVEEWTADGLQIEEKGSYLLERYWFNLYRISI